MKLCPNCHHANPDSSMFCQNCGTKLPTEPVNQMPNQRSQPRPQVNYKICPNCHFKNNMKVRFCTNCGFNFATGRMPQQPKRHHGVITTIVIIVLAILVFGGAYTYFNHSYPFGNGPLGELVGQKTSNSASNSNTRSSNHNSSSSSSSNGASNLKSNETVVKDLWKRVNVKMGGSGSESSSFASLFSNGSDNKAYKNIMAWCKVTTEADNDNSVSVDSIKPYDFSSLSSYKIKYKVRYNFDNGDHNHIQVFEWENKIKDGEIVSMKMLNHSKPVKSYDEK